MSERWMGPGVGVSGPTITDRPTGTPPPSPAPEMGRRQRRLALIALLTAAGIAVAAFPFRATVWGGWILAVAEAGVVGGLADWFAVTALFRRPLGIPIPHTGLIPANWELMAMRVGSLVGERVLTTEYVTREIVRIDIAGLIVKGASLIERTDLESMLDAVARWTADQIAPGSARELVDRLRLLMRDRPVAPLLADVLEAAQRNGWDQRVIETLARALADALARPEFRAALERLVDDIIGDYRRHMGLSSVLFGLADASGLINRRRLVSALQDAVEKIAADPGNLLRQRLCTAIAGLPERLRSEAGLATRVEAAKTRFLESPVSSRLLDAIAIDLQRALVTDLGSGHPELAARLIDKLEHARHRLLADRTFQEDLDRWLKRQAISVVATYQDRLATFIERGVRALGPDTAVRVIEEYAGDDLQYIRVNGTVVGGLVGGVLHGVHLLLELL